MKYYLVSPLTMRIPLFRDLFVITDPGRDQDDEDVLVALNRFICLNILHVSGLVANLSPSEKRARLAKGSLNVLGQPKIPVGIGSSCNQADDDSSLEYQFAVDYMSAADAVEDGEQLIYRTLQDAKPKSVVLLLISGLTDCAAAMRKHTHLFNTAVRRVVIMGGVATEDGLPKLDADGRLLPDPQAQNHAFDLPSAEYVFHQLQDRSIPVTVVSRHAASAARVPRKMYEDMSATGHEVGIRLLKAQQNAMEELWQRCHMAADDANRHGLPGRCDRAWFNKEFCNGQLADALKSGDKVWSSVQALNLYDPCALVAAIPNLRELFFSPYVVEVHGVEHLVVGLSGEEHNVRKPEDLSTFICTTLVESLKMSQQAVVPAERKDEANVS